jgi:RND family efflux transporter MFP subunit
MADPATPVVEITNIGQLNLVANLPGDEGVKIRPGMTARVSAVDLPDRVFAGRVLNAGQVDPQTNLMAVRIAVANPGRLLRVGSFARASVILRTYQRALLIPKSAIILRNGRPVVFVEGPDHIAHQRAVSVGIEQGTAAQVLDGVKSGEKVICLGQYELADGARVQESGARKAGRP